MSASYRRNLLGSTKIQTRAACAALAMSFVGGAIAEERETRFMPGNLLLSRVVYDNNANNILVGTPLPPNCATGCKPATDNGVFPFVFNNAMVDASFGVTSKIIIDQITQLGATINSIEVPNSTQAGVSATKDQMVSSFPSKSELALNLSTDGRFVTFMGYLAPVDAIDISNSNTPAVVDATNPVPLISSRVVAALDHEGKFRFTKTNAYSGNNGRAAILHPAGHVNLLYTSGNAGNGADPQPTGILLGAGAQILAAEHQPLAAQTPGLPTPVGSFNITQLGLPHDKLGKDDNFRGLTIFNNVVYYSKGSGGNGVNTVYFVDTSGTDVNGAPLACPTGSGLPNPSATLPTAPLSYDPSKLAANGLPSNMCILKGFPTAIKSKTSFPFGMWFANAKTLYVADEGNGSATFDTVKGVYSDAAAQTTAGLQKWVFDASAGSWKLAYTLQAGLDLGAPYVVPGYPTGLNSKNKNLPWAPATDGLRNITGKVNRNGTATIWGITSTVSGSGDQGADPNRLAAIVDTVAATTPPAGESFKTLRTAAFAEALRGVSFAPREHDEREDGERSRH
jgi:hypothetical protein